MAARDSITTLKRGSRLEAPGVECGVSSEVSWQPALYLQILQPGQGQDLSHRAAEEDYKEIQTRDN